MIEHPLTKGWIGWVDDEDADLATGFCIRTGSGGLGYAGRYKSGSAWKHNQVNERRHRIIMARILGRALMASEQVDHRHRRDAEQIVDDRRENLRLATGSQNQANSRKLKFDGMTSHFKGTSWDKRDQLWRAYIAQNGKQRSVGYHATELEAARAYDCAALAIFGEFALLNCDMLPALTSWRRAVAKSA